MRRPPFELEVDAIDSRGRARGEVTLADGSRRPVAVDRGLPGERLLVTPQGRRGGTWRARTEEVLRVGPWGDHVEPFCRHANDCGGCTIQDLSYAQQLDLKRAMVSAAWAEAAPSLALPEVPPVLAAPRDRLYRNKLEFTFGAQRWLTADEIAGGETIDDRRALGFHPQGRFDRVIDLSECHLQPEPSSGIRDWLRRWTLERDLPYYDARTHEGFMRAVMVRTSLTGDVLVDIMVASEDETVRESLGRDLTAAFPEVTSLWWTVNGAANDAYAGTEPLLLAGEPVITERCGEILLHLGPRSFFQTNPEQAATLYGVAARWAALTGEELVYDLYSGVGSIALSVARKARAVVGIELVEEAVQAATVNARLNKIANASFIAGSVEERLDEVIGIHGRPDVVIVDPPRAGLHPGARAILRSLAAPRIVYVSCNPRSQAADVADLSAAGYRVAAIQPVDMFPQTRHVECVVLLERAPIAERGPIPEGDPSPKVAPPSDL